MQKNEPPFFSDSDDRWNGQNNAHENASLIDESRPVGQVEKDTSSITAPRIRFICYILHTLLVAIHLILLALWSRHIEHRVTVPIGSQSDTVSIGITVALQGFFTILGAALIVTTQQLALRRNLLQYQTLTGTHDQSAAWSGFGAALRSLWAQKDLPAAIGGVSLIALYLLLISVLHVSSSSLLNLQTYNETGSAAVPTVLGMPPNLGNLFTANYDWADASGVASMIGKVNDLSTVGVINATVYDTLRDTTGIGTATVNASTFLSTCRSLPNVTADSVEAPTGPDDNLVNTFNVTTTIGGSKYVYYNVPAFVQNSLSYIGWAADPSSSKEQNLGQLVFVAVPPIFDDQDNVGSTIPYLRIIGFDSNDNVIYETVTMQVMGCSLSYLNQTAQVGVQTNQLLEAVPSPPNPSQDWESVSWPVVNGTDITNWFDMGFNLSILSTSAELFGHGQSRFFSVLNLRMMDLIGYHTNVSATNQSSVPSPHVTIGELEVALSNVAAAMVWVGARMNTTAAFVGDPFQLYTGQTGVKTSFTQSRLNINTLPVAVGLGSSFTLFILAIMLVREPRRLNTSPNDPAFGAVGILQILWLSSRHPNARRRIGDAPSASENKLRRTGMFNIAFGQTSIGMEQPEPSVDDQTSPLVQLGTISAVGNRAGRLPYQPFTPNRSLSLKQSSKTYGWNEEADRFLEMDELNSDTPHDAPRRRQPSITSSTVSELTRGSPFLVWSCYIMYGLLVAIHLVLLGLWPGHVEHRVTIPVGEQSDTASVALTVILQAFFTLYSAGIIFMTQRLALRSNLLGRQTLTAVHDECGAWTGIGAAVITLWSQIKAPASVRGVLFITIYLSCIVVLHVSSSTLIGLQTYNNTLQTTVPVSFGMPPNMSAYLSSTIPFAPNTTILATVAGKIAELSTTGLWGATVYDTLTDTSGLGNTTVNATTFFSNCYSIPDTTVSIDNKTGMYNVSSAPANMYFDVLPLPQNGINIVGSISPDSNDYISRLVFFVVPPIPDSQGNTGSTVPVQREIIQSNGSSVNETIQMQALACSLSAINQTAAIDVSTNNLLSLDPATPESLQQWQTFQWVTSDSITEQISSLAAILFAGTTSSVEISSKCNSLMDEMTWNSCSFSDIDIRIMDMLGFYTNLAAGNQSTVPTPNVNLVDFENALGNMYAAISWAGSRLYEDSGTSEDVSSTKMVTKYFLESRLNINLLPVAFGLGASSVLAALAVLLTRVHKVPAALTTKPVVASPGILQTIWLASRHPDAHDRIAEVRNPSNEELRRAGMFDISLGRLPIDETTWSIEKSNTASTGA
ncbi:hypothetical protein BJ138DRAFT_352526 [Hygrophoropsis aurantiaca]|uniref:Uncharacterized protein n=1 Tax=Hygrophoropsis aurantiaca TaxID=72124 RepID=A0ACB8A4N7_9AGAM|nr:hypothetical protein BJ138DRAFT_352526 [Hygrophoropsis aurantiaca]